MKFIEDQLEKLDTYFEDKKENEKWVVILGIAGIIAYLAYTYLVPYTEAIYEESEQSKKSLQQSITEHNTYLNSITVTGNREFYIKKFDKDIVDKNKKIVDTSEKIRFIDANLEKLSDMLFNKKSWSKFLNSITDKAAVHDVDIQHIANNYVDNDGNFGYVLEISVRCKGEYKDIIKFMNELEQNKLVTDIYKTKLSLEVNSSYIISDINISVWGINH